MRSWCSALSSQGVPGARLPSLDALIAERGIDPLRRCGDQRNEGVSQVFQQLHVYRERFRVVEICWTSCLIDSHYSIDQDEQLSQGCPVSVAEIDRISVCLDTEIDVVSQ